MSTELYPINLPLYSHLRRTIELAPMNTAPNEAWEQWLCGQVKRGLSQVELDFAIIHSDWPDGTRLSRDNLLKSFATLPSDVLVMEQRRTIPRSFEFIPIQSPVPKGKQPWQSDTDAKHVATMEWYLPAYGFYIARWPRSDLLGAHDEYLVLNKRGALWRTKHLPSRKLPVFADLREAIQWCVALAKRLIPITRKRTQPTVDFAQARLQSGKDYREWMVTTPHLTLNPKFNAQAHFEVDNLLLHLRTSIQEDNGRNFLLLEEIQSDHNQMLQKMQRDKTIEIFDNPYQRHWIELGLRVAVLLALQANMDGIALSTGEMQNDVYECTSRGRAIFYDSIVLGTAKKLAQQVAAKKSAVIVSAERTDYFAERLSISADKGSDYFWRIFNKSGAELPQRFDTKDAAAAYIGENLATCSSYKVPVFWFNAAQRKNILQRGLAARSINRALI